MKVGATTIRISLKTRDMLNRFKIHPRQSYNEVIWNLMVDENLNGDHEGLEDAPTGSKGAEE